MQATSENLFCRHNGLDDKGMKLKGISCGILAAVSYGTNPLGALPLYEEGVNTSSVLFYRFTLASIMLGIMLLVERKSFALNKHELKVISALGMLFAVSSITYYQSFHFVEAGIASTILFVYPVMVAVIMACFFHERVTPATAISMLLSLMGIGLLYQGDANISFSIAGFVLVILSALSYAIYIVVVNQSHIQMSPAKLTFYVLLFCMLSLLVYSFTSPELALQMPPSPRAWLYACWLGLVPTVISLILMTIAVHEVGATPTAIMGALEPLTAVAIGIMLFSESLTLRLAIGIITILVAVFIIVLGKNMNLHTWWHALSHSKRHINN